MPISDPTIKSVRLGTNAYGDISPPTICIVRNRAWAARYSIPPTQCLIVADRDRRGDGSFVET